MQCIMNLFVANNVIILFNYFSVIYYHRETIKSNFHCICIKYTHNLLFSMSLDIDTHLQTKVKKSDKYVNNEHINSTSKYK